MEEVILRCMVSAGKNLDSTMRNTVRRLRVNLRYKACMFSVHVIMKGKMGSLPSEVGYH